MATQVFVQLPSDAANTGRKEDHVQVSPSTYYREVIAIGSPTSDTDLAPVDATSGLKVNLGADNGVAVANGADVTQGAVADVAVVGDNSGTVSAKLRGINKIWNDVWDSVNHWLKVSIQNTTLAVTQSGSWVLSAGSAIIGKVSIDQTTPGTTNGVQVNAALPAGSNVIGHVITDTGSTTAVTGTVTVAGAVTEASLDAALISQEATTAGIKGLTHFGAVTTAAPTYTTAKSDALSLQTNGSLRTAVTDALPAGANVIGHVITDTGSTTAVTGTVTVSGTVTANPKSDVLPATQNITAQDSGSTVTPGQNSQSIITGSPTANSTASFALSTVDSIRVQASGTWTGTLQLELSPDGGTSWYINGGHLTGTTYNIGSATSNFAAIANVGGATHFRVRAIAAMTGTAVITVNESVNPNLVYLANPAKIADPTTPTQQAAVSTRGEFNIQGGVASGGVEAGNPVSVGGKALSAAPSAVATGQRVVGMNDLWGRRHIRSGAQAPVASTFTGIHVPATNVKATITQASAGSGKRNVCTGFTFTLTAGASAIAAAAPIIISVIDGASGGSTYLYRSYINVPAVAGAIASINRSGLWLVGSQATALTIEFSAAGGVNSYESVALDGVIVEE